MKNNEIAQKVSKSGDTMTGTLDVNDNMIRSMNTSNGSSAIITTNNAEGGALMLYATNSYGNYAEIDMNNGHLRFCIFDAYGTYDGSFTLLNTGQLIADSIIIPGTSTDFNTWYNTVNSALGI